MVYLLADLSARKFKTEIKKKMKKFLAEISANKLSLNIKI
jgi:hypothetical protein